MAINPALLGLVPIFKDSIGQVIGAGADVVRSYGKVMESYGRGAEAIMTGIGQRIGGGPRQP